MINLKNKILLNSLFFSTLGMAAYGCGGAGEDKGTVPECVNNDECHGGRVCVDEKCVFPSESSTDAGIEEEIYNRSGDASVPANTELSYLPAGVKVAFVSGYDSSEGIWEYCVLDSSGKITKKTDTPNYCSLNSLSWSPDGKYWAASMCSLVF